MKATFPFLHDMNELSTENGGKLLFVSLFFLWGQVFFFFSFVGSTVLENLGAVIMQNSRFCLASLRCCVSSCNHLLKALLLMKFFEINLVLTVSPLLSVLPAFAENHKGSNFSHFMMETSVCNVILQRLLRKYRVFPSNGAAH